MSVPGFSANPFVVANASLRAGIADREEVLRILGDAYADGKLDEVEYEERPPTKAEIAQQVAKERRVRRTAIVGAVGGWAALAVLFNTIWLLTSLSSGEWIYYWPMWPMLGVGIGAVGSALPVLQVSRHKERKMLEQGDGRRELGR